MKSLSAQAKRLPGLFLLGAVLVSVGCEGTQSREHVDDAVEEMAGQKDLERYRKMKDDLGDIQKRQTERLQQLDGDKQDQ